MLTEKRTALDQLRYSEVNKRARPLTDIRAGDRVWTGTYRHPRSGGIKYVVKLTPTQVLVQATPLYQERYKRAASLDMLFSLGGSGVISGIATPAECKAWDAALAEKEEAERLKEIDIEQLERRRTALNTEIGQYGGFVSQAFDQSGDKWELAFSSLTADQVRQIAAALKSAGFKHEGEK
jgi:hypothetical protein